MAGFSGGDWAVFVVSLMASLGIGIWAGWMAKRNTGGDAKAAASEFLMGGRKMNPFAVAMSTMIGAISSVTVVGNPAEMYAYGTQLWMNLIGTTIGMVYVHLVILTVMYPLKITSVYTYIEKRFDSKGLRSFTVFTTFIGTFFYLGLVSYSPSLAMETVTGFPAWASIIIMGIICTIYSSWGGVRAVVYTDILQTFVMFVGVIVIIISATVEAGGLESVWSVADDLSPDPLQRHSLWTVTVQGYFFALLVFGMGQPQVQRICSVETWNKAIFAHYLNLIANVTVFCCVNFMGIAVYAVYASCDPMATGEISKPDEIVPHYVIDRLSYSSQINAVTAVMWEDFFKNSQWVARMADNRKPLVNVLVSVITGMAGILAGVVASQMGGLFQVGQTILGTIHAPLLGLFILGMCCPFANKIGGIVGFSVSLLFNLWVTIGAMLYGRATPYLEFSDEGCNATTPFDLTTTTPLDWTTTEFTSSTDPQEPGEKSRICPVPNLKANGVTTFFLFTWSPTLSILSSVSLSPFSSARSSLFSQNRGQLINRGKIYVHPTFYKLMKMWEERRPREDPAASTKDLVSLEKF
ncbi:sodium-coupled monocarboxylate transporter 2-like [Penaeus monodon]|uniref:sodium-coupled monocarboxylate transporter 2-like n=1 Tax=Penaeus monodon TaxID=6687 RepID=UPI0018A78C94|nr:sodium-coupled monocarboxylate transporter 2-like [Penaeus monodon]